MENPYPRHPYYPIRGFQDHALSFLIYLIVNTTSYYYMNGRKSYMMNPVPYQVVNMTESYDYGYVLDQDVEIGLFYDVILRERCIENITLFRELYLRHRHRVVVFCITIDNLYITTSICIDCIANDLTMKTT